MSLPPCLQEIRPIQETRKRSAEASEAATCSLVDSETSEREKKRPMRFQEKLPKIHKEKVRFISASSPYVQLQINTIHTYSRMVYSNNCLSLLKKGTPAGAYGKEENSKVN